MSKAIWSGGDKQGVFSRDEDCLPLYIYTFICSEGFPGGSVVKNPPAMQETWVQSLALGLSLPSPGEGNGNPLQYSCLENSMDREA